MKKITNNKGMSVVVILLFVAVVLAVAFYFVWKSITPSIQEPVANTDIPKEIGKIEIAKSPTPKPKATPTPTPIPLIPDNGVKGTYQVGMGAHDGPTITQVIFDPLDAKKGQTLNLTVKASFTSAISTLTGTLTTDHGAVDINFTQSSGSATDGMWSGSVTLQDTVDYKYILTLTAKASNGKSSSVTVAPRS